MHGRTTEHAYSVSSAYGLLSVYFLGAAYTHIKAFKVEMYDIYEHIFKFFRSSFCDQHEFYCLGPEKMQL